MNEKIQKLKGANMDIDQLRRMDSHFDVLPKIIGLKVCDVNICQDHANLH